MESCTNTKGQITVAAVQMYCNRSRKENLEAAEKRVREAAEKGAQVILLPELFETWYFCQERNACGGESCGPAALQGGGGTEGGPACQLF